GGPGNHPPAAGLEHLALLDRRWLCHAVGCGGWLSSSKTCGTPQSCRHHSGGHMSVLVETQALERVLPATVPVTLVSDITLSISDNEFVAITGPSGSGKSSLLYLLGLLDRPSAGTLTIGG